MASRVSASNAKQSSTTTNKTIPAKAVISKTANAKCLTTSQITPVTSVGIKKVVTKTVNKTTPAVPISVPTKKVVTKTVNKTTPAVPISVPTKKIVTKTVTVSKKTASVRKVVVKKAVTKSIPPEPEFQTEQNQFDDIELLDNSLSRFSECDTSINPDNLIDMQNMSEQINDDTVTMNCPDCTFHCHSIFHLEIHRLKKHLPKDAICKCLLCDNRNKHMQKMSELVKNDNKDNELFGEFFQEINVYYRAMQHHLANAHKQKYVEAKNQGPDHIKELYYIPDSLKCKFCEYRGDLQYLINHISNKHIVPTEQCPKCNKTMKKTAMRDHLKLFHADASETYQHSCDPCKRTYKTEKELLKHNKTIKHRKQIQKKDAIEKSQQTLAENNVNMHIYKCTECDEQFHDRYPCDAHLRKVHGIEVRKHVCTCGNKYKTQSGLINHQKTCDKILLSNPVISKPIKQKKFPCPYDTCDKSFDDNWHVKRHIASIHKPEYVLCTLCNKHVIKREYDERHQRVCTVKSQFFDSPGDSELERKISKYLADHNINFRMQEKFHDLKRKNCLPYDFYLPDRRMFIEANGSQHYIPMSYRNGEEKLKETQESDRMKKEYADRNGYTLIVIDERDYKGTDALYNFLDDTLGVY